MKPTTQTRMVPRMCGRWSARFAARTGAMNPPAATPQMSRAWPVPAAPRPRPAWTRIEGSQASVV
ncbi:hypothetical protein CQW39_31490 [Streptomyces griseofuscus]|uniref:Uncharacterized protein n=1 Tax=Streptomyces griseofuscus TaxID=146922 RepID=A0A3R8QHM3_9ACTN|nr:hypothetical protein CQW39_31490 [Streptomyces griseofuscus]RRQ86254.1 hypothetical protein CQW44_15320 [Streptomyces griseofuscus]